MNRQMILSLLKRVLAWIGTRFQSREIDKESDHDDSEVSVISDTPVKEQPLVILDKPAHPSNYGNRPERTDTSLIVLHYTASGSLDETIRWFRNSNAKVSAHDVIGRDGTIVRMVPAEKKAYHAGKSEWNGKKDVNRFLNGIELVNWGKLVKCGDDFFTWPKDYTNPYHGLDPVFLEDAWWEPYPDAQIDSLRLLLSDIQKRYSILGVMGHKDVLPGRKIDPDPALNTSSFL